MQTGQARVPLLLIYLALSGECPTRLRVLCVRLRGLYQGCVT